METSYGRCGWCGNSARVIFVTAGASVSTAAKANASTCFQRSGRDARSNDLGSTRQGTSVSTGFAFTDSLESLKAGACFRSTCGYFSRRPVGAAKTYGRDASSYGPSAEVTAGTSDTEFKLRTFHSRIRVPSTQPLLVLCGGSRFQF